MLVGIRFEKQNNQILMAKVFELDLDKGGLVEVKDDPKGALSEGQVIFLNGYGQNEHSHKRIVVYEVFVNEFYQKPAYKTINLDDLTLRTIQSSEVRPVEQLRGIGLYYKEGEFASKDEVMKALPLALDKQRKELQSREAANLAEKERRAKSNEWFRANRPSWAKAIIVARLEEDKSDGMTDYFGSHTKTKLILAWSSTDRNNFNEFRQAARNAEETAFLAEADKSYENRDNYTGGNGYWLGKHRYSGWQISKENLPEINSGQYSSISLEDIRIPKESDKPSITPVAASGGQARLNINKSKNGIELYFPGKPSSSVLDDLKANGWRWSRFNSCWYAHDSTTARAFAAKYSNSSGIEWQQDAQLVQAQEDAVSDNFCQSNNI